MFIGRSRAPFRDRLFFDILKVSSAVQWLQKECGRIQPLFRCTAARIESLL